MGFSCSTSGKLILTRSSHPEKNVQSRHESCLLQNTTSVNRHHLTIRRFIVTAAALLFVLPSQMVCMCSCAKGSGPAAKVAVTVAHQCCQEQDESGHDRSHKCPCGCQCKLMWDARLTRAARSFDSSENNDILKSAFAVRTPVSAKPHSPALAVRPVHPLTALRHCASLCRFLL